MKTLWIFLAAGVGFLPLSGYSTQTAQARLFCWSLRFQGAAANDSYGFQWRIDLTTLSSGDNGELAPDFFNSGYNHSTYIDLYSELYDETDPGAMAMDVPDGGDANGNGFPDFWEVSQGVNGLSSTGVIQCSALGINYNLTAQWHRDAGSATGTCVITFPDPDNPFNNITFTHSFELIEYAGPLTYTPGPNSISSSVDLVQTGNPANTFQGQFEFTKATGDPFNTLTLQTMLLTNATQQTLDLFASTSIFRDTTLLTNYYGNVSFNDGDPNTPQDDYYSWELSIDDTNDSDGDTIPDFSDDPQTTLPRQPLLLLTRGPTNLWLTISGDVGRVHQIVETTSLALPHWTTNQSLTLTNDPQTVSLPLPTTMTKFWNVIAN